MNLNNKSIEQFQYIWKKEFKQEISKKDSARSAEQLLNLLKVIYEPRRKHK